MSGLDVDGGSAGVTAELDELAGVAAALDRIGDQVRGCGATNARLTLDPQLLSSVALSPVTGAHAVAALGGVGPGVGGLITLSISIEVTSRGVRAALLAYQTVDRAVALAFEEIQDGIGWGLGFAVGTMAPAIVAVGAGVVVTDRIVDALPAPVRGALHQAWDDSGFDDATGAIGQDLDDLWRRGLFEAPWAVDVLAGSAPEVMQGLQAGAAPWASWELTVAGAATGTPWPPRTYEDSVAVVIAGGRLFGDFDDGAVASVHQVDPLPGSRAPATTADLFSQEAGLTDPRHHSHVRVVQVPEPDGTSAWVVEIPGTQEWDPDAGPDPFDLTGDLHLMAGEKTTAMQAVGDSLEAAMADAGVPAGQPVMLSGHSQGGIIAASLAASPRFRSRYNVTHVVTSGAPIARVDMPTSVEVLSLEHEQDIVPRLEGESNPDRPDWVTVHRDLTGVVDDPIAAHDRDLYAETARMVDASDDPSLVTWREGSSEFLRGEGVVREYAVQRTTPD